MDVQTASNSLYFEKDTSQQVEHTNNGVIVEPENQIPAKENENILIRVFKFIWDRIVSVFKWIKNKLSPSKAEIFFDDKSQDISNYIYSFIQAADQKSDQIPHVAIREMLKYDNIDEFQKLFLYQAFKCYKANITAVAMQSKLWSMFKYLDQKLGIVKDSTFKNNLRAMRNKLFQVHTNFFKENISFFQEEFHITEKTKISSLTSQQTQALWAPKYPQKGIIAINKSVIQDITRCQDETILIKDGKQSWDSREETEETEGSPYCRFFKQKEQIPQEFIDYVRSKFDLITQDNKELTTELTNNFLRELTQEQKFTPVLLATEYLKEIFKSSYDEDKFEFVANNEANNQNGKFRVEISYDSKDNIFTIMATAVFYIKVMSTDQRNPCDMCLGETTTTTMSKCDPNKISEAKFQRINVSFKPAAPSKSL